MNEAIESFITDVFTNEFISSIRKSFSLFEAFEHQDAYSGMMDAVMNESVSDIAARADHFSVELTNQLDFVIQQHLIVLQHTATIQDRNLILEALYQIQHLESYIPFYSILDSEDDSIDKMSLILEELTHRDQGYWLTVLKFVADQTIELLRKFIDGKENPHPEEPVNPEIVERLRLFNKVFGEDNLGYVIITAGMRPGYDFDLYIPFVEELIVDSQSQEQTIKNFLSIVYMSNVAESEILTLYRTKGEEMLKSAVDVGRMESTVLSMIAKFGEAKKIQDEQKRLSEESASNQPRQ